MLGMHKPQQQATITKQKNNFPEISLHFRFRNPRDKKILNSGIFIYLHS